MKYPLILQEFSADVQLYIPDPNLVKEIYEDLRSKNTDELFPYWAKVWPSALALSKFLVANQTIIKGKSILELGAGLGLPSFTIAPYARNIIITDYAKDAVDLLQYNIDSFGYSTIKAASADWTNLQEDIMAEVILMSDTNYEPSQFNGLLLTITDFLSKGSTIVLATPQRITATPFVAKLHEYIIQSELIEIDNNQLNTTIGIFVLHKNI